MLRMFRKKSPEDRVRALADSLMSDDPLLAACLVYLTVAAKNGALPGAYKRLGELISHSVNRPGSTA